MSVFELFDKTRRYVVPLYQRQYVWTKDGQWEPLWENIREKAAAVVASTQQPAKTPSNHFLGAVVLNQRPTFGLQIDTAEIIDGQQRLTTLQLFLAALRDIAATTDREALCQGLTRLTRHSDVMEDEAVEIFKVWPTNSDRADFAKVLSAGSCQKVEDCFPQQTVGKKKLPRPTMAEAYFYFYRSINDFVHTGGSDSNGSNGKEFHPERLQALYNTLRKHLEVIVIELEKDDDPQVIFETLNFGGVPLFPSDLVRNFVFLRANQQGAKADKLYQSHWLEYDTSPAESVDGDSNLFWKRTEKQGRNKRTRLDLFLHHYLTYRTEDEVNIGHLFKEFREWWETEPRSVDDELASLRRHSDVFRGFFVPDTSTRLGRFAARLRKLDTSTVYPLLLLLVIEGASMPTSEFNAILIDLESYLIRRAVCGLSNKQYNRFFLQLLQSLRKAGAVNHQNVRNYLLAAQGSSTIWPADKEFEKKWVREPAYTNLGPAATGMILDAIDHQLRTSKCETIAIQGALTVEHVLPQTWAEHWPLDGNAALEPTADEDSEEIRNRLLHSFGNLTLLTTPLNASIQNGPFSSKRPEIAKQSSLRLNVYFQDFLDSDPWNEEVILKRGQDLFDVACTVWPYPL
jgi:uncharacterized protein with ParB-like and HNH nuclease domain